MEDRQITDYYQAQRHIQSTIMSDTPIKTAQNRQYIDNVSDYDSELHRISKSVHYKLDLGPISLLGAQQHTTVETAAALKIQDKTESDFIAYMQNNNGQYRTEIYNKAESMMPQLDGTHNVSDSSNTDLHDYLDLASTNIIQYRTKGQKKRQKASKAEYTNRCLANIEYIKLNTGLRNQRQKVPDNEDIDMDKIVKDDMPRYAIKRDLKEVLHDRKVAKEAERQLKEKETKRLALEKAKRLQTEKDIKEKEAKRLALEKAKRLQTEKDIKEKEAKRLSLEKAKRLQTEKDIKEKEAKRLALEKAQIEALINKHKPHTPKTPDEVNTPGTGKNANIDGKEGTEKGKPLHKKATKASQIKMSQNKGDKSHKGKSDTLLGDPVVNTKNSINKAKATEQKDTIGIDDIGIFEFIFEGQPNPPDLEGIDEDRLFELQNAVQEQLHKRDEERERNITKRVQEFEKTFDFVNSHLLKGVATMA